MFGFSKKTPPTDDESREYKMDHKHVHPVAGEFYELTKLSEKWKPPYLAESCPFCFDADSANKGKQFGGVVFRRRHCFKCGDIGCKDHVPKTVLCGGQCKRRLCVRCIKPISTSGGSLASSAVTTGEKNSTMNSTSVGNHPSSLTVSASSSSASPTGSPLVSSSTKPDPSYL